VKQLILPVVVAVLCLAGGFGLNLWLRQQAPPPDSSTLPVFSLPTLDGRKQSLSKWQGKIRVINFWATWCPPCRKEIPELVALQAQYPDELVVIGVAIDDQEAIVDFLKTTTINYPVLLGDSQCIGLSRQLGNSKEVIPFTVIADQQGKIVFSQVGEFAGDKVKAVLEPLILRK
jgi:thiol-disulfide isomerase/thioredoxin